MTQTLITMTRRVTFSAAHLLLSPQSNAQADKFSSSLSRQQETSGHNYSLDVCVTGQIDSQTGIVVNIKEIDQIVRKEVLANLDGKLINGANGPLAGKAATGENLLHYVNNALIGKLPASVSLSALLLERSPLERFEWHAEGTTPIKHVPHSLVTRQYEFSASHRLHSPALSDDANRNLFGKCNYANGHGHNYVLEVTVGGPLDGATHRVIDTSVLDSIVNTQIIDRYDHRHLNLDIPEFQNTIPSSEIVAKTIWDRIVSVIPGPAFLYRILLRETPRNFFEYYGED